MADEIFLRATGIRKSYSGVQALEGVDLVVRRGEIHCLAGENGSGKSTLIKAIAGVLRPDEGSIAIEGRSYDRLSPIEAIREGIQIIYQDLSLFPNLTVAENLALNQQLAKGRRLVDWKEVRRTARQALEQIGVELPLDALVEDLPIADRQLIAIARALVNDARLLIMDEPTTALTQREVDTLLGIMRRLQRDGVGILFVSHKLNEVFSIAETITVLRNGRRVSSGPKEAYDWSRLARDMTGRELGAAAAERSEFRGDGDERLRVEGLAKRGQFVDVSFSVRAGEILGITGLLGSGRTPLALSLFGLAPYDRGRVFIDGRETRIASVRDAIDAGIAYVPEDRLTEGLFLPQAVGDNIVASRLDRHTGPAGVLDAASVRGLKRDWIEKLHIVTPSPELPVENLSGGNQQRVVLARWLATDPKILILNGPTVGVDIGSKRDIHAIVRDLARSGMAVIVISDDLPELLETCHRLLVMRDGRMVDALATLDADENDLAARLAG